MLLIIIVAAIALGVVAMHQLSSHHTFTLPQQGSSAAHQAAAYHAMDTTRHDHSASQSEARPDVPGQNAAAGIACDECGQHALMVSCLLALTLLVVGWLLQTPPWRVRPPHWIPRYPQRVRTPILNQPRCLSLLELSISRT